MCGDFNGIRGGLGGGGGGKGVTGLRGGVGVGGVFECVAPAGVTPGSDLGPSVTVERVGDARLPTDIDTFRIVSYRASDGHEHVALIAGDPTVPSSQPVLFSLHSE